MNSTRTLQQDMRLQHNWHFRDICRWLSSWSHFWQYFVVVVFNGHIIIVNSTQQQQQQQILLNIGNITNYITFPPANSL